MPDAFMLAFVAYVVGVVLGAIVLGFLEEGPHWALLWPVLLPTVVGLWALEMLAALGKQARERWGRP